MHLTKAETDLINQVKTAAYADRLRYILLPVFFFFQKLHTEKQCFSEPVLRWKFHSSSSHVVRHGYWNKGYSRLFCMNVSHKESIHTGLSFVTVAKCNHDMKKWIRSLTAFKTWCEHQTSPAIKDLVPLVFVTTSTKRMRLFHPVELSKLTFRCANIRSWGSDRFLCFRTHLQRW